MRLIGGHDFYDSALSYGRDDDLIYVRKKEEIEIPHPPIHPSEVSIGTSYNSQNVNPFEIIFAGKLYYGIKISKETQTEYVYSVESLIKTLDKFNMNISQIGRINYRSLFDISQLSEHFIPFDISEFCRENKIISGVTTREIRWSKVYNKNYSKTIFQNNATLKDYEFQKVLNPFEAMQQLSMWVGNLSTNENNMATISDKDKIHKHGFDNWSFRKMKELK